MMNFKEMNFNFVNCAWTDGVDKTNSVLPVFSFCVFSSVQIFSRPNIEEGNKILDGNRKKSGWNVCGLWQVRHFQVFPGTGINKGKKVMDEDQPSEAMSTMRVGKHKMWSVAQ